MTSLARVVPIALSVAVLAACGGTGNHAASQSKGSSNLAARQTQTGLRTTVYFLTDTGKAPIGVRRSIERGSTYARSALDVLLAGPSDSERRAGITSALPAKAQVQSLTIDGVTATVDLSGLPAQNDANAVIKARVITQISRTLIGLSGIDRVRLQADGSPWGLWNMSGGVQDVAYDYPKLLGFYHVCVAKPGTETVPGDCFTALP
jgi:spore germination protein GerM